MTTVIPFNAPLTDVWGSVESQPALAEPLDQPPGPRIVENQATIDSAIVSPMPWTSRTSLGRRVGDGVHGAKMLCDLLGRDLADVLDAEREQQA